jgi:hypothetical protein
MNRQNAKVAKDLMVLSSEMEIGTRICPGLGADIGLPEMPFPAFMDLAPWRLIFSDRGMAWEVR